MKTSRATYGVFGLGTFGRETAAALHRFGAHVLAIDRDERVVEEMRSMVSAAYVCDAGNDEALRQIGAFDVDTAVVALGVYFAQSVLLTHTLQRAGVKAIHVQVNSLKEAEAVKAIGASAAVFPERDTALALSRRLVMPGLADQIPLGDSHGIVDIVVPGPWVGRSLKELNLRATHGVTVLAVQARTEGTRKEVLLAPPDPLAPLREGNHLFVLGEKGALAAMREKLG